MNAEHKDGVDAARHEYRERLESEASASPIVDELNKLNHGVRRFLRLCTPSILLAQPRVEDPLGSDVSVSYEGNLGSPLEALNPKTKFGKLAELVLAQYGGDPQRDGSWLLTNGSTGANWTVAVYLRRLLKPGDFVLVARGAHISLPQALTDLGIDWDYLAGEYSKEWEAAPPARVDAVKDALTRIETNGTKTQLRAVCLNSPTYEGLFLDTEAIRKTLNDAGLRSVLLVVDEAWGAHLPWGGPDLARRAAFAHADIVNSSSHKQGGALQGAAILVARGGNVDIPALDGAYQSVASTSPSYQLLASMDAAYRLLRIHGIKLIGDSADMATSLADQLRRVASVQLFHRDDLSRADDSDPLKITIKLDRRRTGFDVQKALVRRRIVIEKATIDTITFLIPFQLLSWDDADDRLAEVAQVVATELASPPLVPVPAPPDDPFTAGRNGRRVAAYEAARRRGESDMVDYVDAVGRIAAERVAAYPPGVPIIAEGYEVTVEETRYLSTIHGLGGHIVSNGGSPPGKVKVLPDE